MQPEAHKAVQLEAPKAVQLEAPKAVQLEAPKPVQPRLRWRGDITCALHALGPNLRWDVTRMAGVSLTFDELLRVQSRCSQQQARDSVPHGEAAGETMNYVGCVLQDDCRVMGTKMGGDRFL